jgi:hypothetical protein
MKQDNKVEKKDGFVEKIIKTVSGMTSVVSTAV